MCCFRIGVDVFPMIMKSTEKPAEKTAEKTAEKPAYSVQN